MKKKKRTGLYIILGFILILGLSTLISTLTAKEEVKFNNITYSEYKKLYNSNKLEFVYVGRSGCSYCKMTVPLLGELQKEEDMEWNYLDTDTMSQADFTDIAKTADAFAGEWGTPTLLAIKDGKVLNSISGYREKGVLKSFVEASKKGEVWKEPTA